ncbi:hypothetical protein [Tsukamurella soli]|uniref:hypothetical protein n=1 Tax=Tsukamurella soli TaxID=644556 RepID=UPI0031ECDE8C
MSLVDGIPLAEAVRDAAAAVSDGSWAGVAGGGWGVIGAVGDLVADPVGTIAGAGFGWIFEHVPVLREALDKVSGDPNAVEALCTAWSDDVAGPLVGVAAAFANAVSGTEDAWTGPAADAYRAAGAELAGHVEAVADAARGAAAGVRMAGTLVLEVRTWIRDQLAQFAEWLAVGYAIAAASAVPTGGASVATWINGAVAKGARLAQRFTGRIDDLMRKFEALVGHLGRLGEAVRELRRTSGRVHAAVGRARVHGESGTATDVAAAGVVARHAAATPSLVEIAKDAGKSGALAVAKSMGDGWKTFAATDSGASTAGGRAPPR